MPDQERRRWRHAPQHPAAQRHEYRRDIAKKRRVGDRRHGDGNMPDREIAHEGKARNRQQHVIAKAAGAILRTRIATRPGASAFQTHPGEQQGQSEQCTVEGCCYGADLGQPHEDWRKRNAHSPRKQGRQSEADDGRGGGQASGHDAHGKLVQARRQRAILRHRAARKRP